MLPFAGMDVVVLAGGLGSRIRSVLGDTPKVLAPVHGRPFLDYILDHLHRLGAARVILSLGFLADKVEAHLRDYPSPLPIEVVVEPVPMGTGGGLRFVIPHIRTASAMVMNGDTWLDTDYAAFVDFHHAHQSPCTILCVPVDDVARYGHLTLATDGQVEKFVEKDSAMGAGLISGGVYLFERNALNDVLATTGNSLERDFLQTRTAGNLFGYAAPAATFIDIGTPESFGQAGTIVPAMMY